MKKALLSTFLPLALAALLAPAAGAQTSSMAGQASGVTVIQNATILTVTKGTIENGSILIREGKIARVGRRVRVPRGATVIDATGLYVIPGIIDAHSHIAADSINEGSVAVSAMTGIDGARAHGERDREAELVAAHPTAG